MSPEKGTWLVCFWSEGEKTGNFSSDPVRTSASGQKRGTDSVGIYLHELLGKDPPRRLGWDIGCFDTGKSPPRDRAGESGVSRAPQSRADRWGLSKQGRRYQLSQGSRIRTNSAMVYETWGSCGLVGPSLRGLRCMYRSRDLNTW